MSIAGAFPALGFVFALFFALIGGSPLAWWLVGGVGLVLLLARARSIPDN